MQPGPTASFLNNAKGTYASIEKSSLDVLPSPEFIELEGSSDVIKVLLQANAAIGVKYWITTRWNVWGSYGYSHGINSMLDSYEQKPKLNTLRFGVEYKL